MKMLNEKDIIKKIYPDATRKRYLGTKKHFTVFADARNMKDSVNLMALRANLSTFIKDFHSGTGMNPRDIWKSNRRIFQITKIVFQEVLS